MKTIEELKGMTHEDLVAYVQDLERNLVAENKECEKFEKWWNDECKKHRDFKEMMKTMLNLMK